MNQKTLVIRRQVIGLLLCVLMITTALGAVAGITKQKVERIELNITDPLFHFDVTTKDTTKYTTITLDGEGFTTVIGEAQLPMIRKMVEIPYGATPQITISDISWQSSSLQTLGLPPVIVPVQEPLVKIPDAKENFIVNTHYYSMNKYLPDTLVSIIGIGDIRGHRYALVEIAPVQYNPSTGDLRLLESCTITITLPGSDLKQTMSAQQRYSSSLFENMYQNLFANYGQFYPTDGGSKDPVGYLIIVYDTFYEEIQPFVTWKQNNGFTVTVTKTSQIIGGATYANIEAYIDTAYATWTPPPTYVLLVGDTAQVPTKTTGLQSGVSCSDLYYACVGTADYYPDMFLGRFPAATEAQVTAMVTKTQTYLEETYPSSEFLTKAVFMASSDHYTVSEGTHNYVIETYLEPNQWQCDKLYYHQGATTQQVRDAFNDGRILGVYSGHGGETSWGDGPPFSQADVNGLTNLGEYPFVFSHACVTGSFAVSECFGETWLRAANKASIFFWGASASTYWDEDDWLERNWFKAWWDDGLESIGPMTVQGMIYTIAQMGGPGGGSSRYYAEAYNILGDPSLQLDAIEFVWENDVGPVSITQPPDTTVGGPITVATEIQNFGINDQYDVPVSCEIYSGGEEVYLNNFEADNGGFTASGTATWQWGVPTSGPGAAHSGTKLWATNLAGDYPSSANAYLTSGTIQLPAETPTELSFWHWYEFESLTGSYAWDGGNVEISVNSGAWTVSLR